MIEMILFAIGLLAGFTMGVYAVYPWKRKGDRE